MGSHGPGTASAVRGPALKAQSRQPGAVCSAAGPTGQRTTCWQCLVMGKGASPVEMLSVVAYLGSVRLRKSSKSGTVNAVSPWAGL